jgi:hypothetical protein
MNSFKSLKGSSTKPNIKNLISLNNPTLQKYYFSNNFESNPNCSNNKLDADKSKSSLENKIPIEDTISGASVQPKSENVGNHSKIHVNMGGMKTIEGSERIENI